MELANSVPREPNNFGIDFGGISVLLSGRNVLAQVGCC